MPDELYLWKPDDAAYQVSGVMKPAGFTLADVLRLAVLHQSFANNPEWGPRDETALAPFASLLREKNDAQ
jgi:hypothetical protein